MSEVPTDDSLMPTQSLNLRKTKTQAKIDSQHAASQSLSRLMRREGRNEEPKEGKQLGLPRRNSQDCFSEPEQTIIIFDWDDTLFPTTWIRHEKGIHWRYPLDQQTKTFSLDEISLFKRQLKSLEGYVERVLEQAKSLGHVVIVTLARPPWVQLSCENFFPHIGKFLVQNSIKIVYAQDLAGSKDYDKQKFSSDVEAEMYWIQKKQRAIMGEVSLFYAQSSSSWKNLISLGDSDFERFAAQASVKDYATLDVGEADSEPTIGSASAKLALLKPSTSKSIQPDNYAVSGFVGTHYRRLRCKTVKMFDSPGIEDLATEMSMLYKWMPFLVGRDAGFDVDLEEESKLYAAHFDLTGENLVET